MLTCGSAIFFVCPVSNPSSPTISSIEESVAGKRNVPLELNLFKERDKIKTDICVKDQFVLDCSLHLILVND